MKTAVFGGSFDPPHLGHLLACSYARAVGFDQVLVVPVFQHAFSKQLAPYEERLALCRLAFEQTTSVIVSAIEQHLPQPNFTLDTLRHIGERHPDWHLRLLVGSDILKDVEHWRAFEEVVALAPLYVLGRVGHPHPAAPHELLPAVSSTEVRQRLPSTAKEDLAWLGCHVPRRVLERIRLRGLYGTTVDDSATKPV